ncbi:MAG: 4-hydroxythreonine-4-phosphate dehydrogenase PdxA [Alphaproteobacteria bacterium]|nr:4-hydroxythreonine-4-phosphate dehydrogenase PdxA [Alphaproteobacteria bacterium]
MAAPLALSMGEPAGIAPEITLKAWIARREERLAPFFFIGDPAVLTDAAASLGLTLPLVEIARPAEAPALFDRALPVLPVALPERAQAGHLDPRNSPAVLRAIDVAVEFCRAGEASGLVTNPIHKKALQDAGFRHPGHTEYLAELCGGMHPLMLFDSALLRVAPVTIHVPLREAISMLNRDLLLVSARLAAASLRQDFGVKSPRIAVAGLNPHAGEQGSLGREDLDVIAPAVEAMRAEGIDAFGPLPPDAMFHAAARQRYDLALCMYHDQALIPLKTLDFDGAVNVTAGLPIVRTSPDHGTALDIAGRGSASPRSLIAAIRCAAGIAHQRAGAGKANG